MSSLNWPLIFACLILGFGFCSGLIILILKRSRTHAESGRSSEFHHGHTAPIPRLGGLAIAAAFAACAVTIYFSGTVSPANETSLIVITIGSLAMFGLGLWDDLRYLSATFKLGGQVLISTAVYAGGIRIEMLTSPVSYAQVPLGIFGYLVTVLWLVSLTNLINLIDGIDGLAGGICLMLMFLLANVGLGGDSGCSMLLAVGVSGALVAFLRFNYPPAKIYMGDGGAYFLGFLIGILSIVNSNKGTIAAALIAPAFALALPIVDVSLAVLRRGLRGLPIFRPDQKHIHHHLITLGISRERTLLNLYTVCLLCLVLAFGVFFVQGRMLPLYTGMLFLVLLIAGHLSGFTKNWFAISSQLGKWLALRKETQYALTLNRWLVMEVDRQNSVDELWHDFEFVVKKLGFCRVKVTLAGSLPKVWSLPDFDESEGELHQASHEMSNGTIVELFARKATMPELLFNLFGDLAAEAWYKVAARWKLLKKPPLRFSAGAASPGRPIAESLMSFYSPVEMKSTTTPSS